MIPKIAKKSTLPLKRGTTIFTNVLQKVLDENKNVKNELLIVKILKRSTKTLEEARYILDYIKEFKFFNDFFEIFGDSTEEALLLLCRNVTYEYFPFGSVVFKEGDESNDKLYVILSGHVSFLMKESINIFLDQNIASIENQDNKEKSIMEQETSSEDSGEGQNSKDQTGFQKYYSSRKFQRSSLVNEDSDNKGSISPSKSSHRESVRKKGKRLTGKTDNSDMESSVVISRKKTIEMTASMKKSSVTSERKASIATPNFLKEFLAHKSNPFMKGKHPSKIPEVMEEIIKNYGFKRNEMGVGEGFGEKAILEVDKKLAKRRATALTTTDCDMLVIKRVDFMKVTNKYDRQQDLKKEFLMKNIPFLNQINSKKILHDLLYDFKFETFSRNHYVTKQGQSGDKMFLLYSGECMIEQEVVTGFNHFGQNKLKICLSYIGTTTVIGEEIIFSHQKIYENDIWVTSHEAKFFSITKGKLKYKFPLDTVKKIFSRFKLKQCFRQIQMQTKIKKHLEKIKEENKFLKTLNLGKPEEPDEFRFYCPSVLRKKQKDEKSKVEKIGREKNLQASVFYSQNYNDLKIHAIRDEIINNVITGELNVEKLHSYQNYKTYELDIEDDQKLKQSGRENNDESSFENNSRINSSRKEYSEEEIPPLLLKPVFSPLKQIYMERGSLNSPRNLTIRRTKKIKGSPNEEMSNIIEKGDNRWKKELNKIFKRDSLSDQIDFGKEDHIPPLRFWVKDGRKGMHFVSPAPLEYHHPERLSSRISKIQEMKEVRNKKFYSVEKTIVECHNIFPSTDKIGNHEISLSSIYDKSKKACRGNPTKMFSDKILHLSRNDATEKSINTLVLTNESNPTNFPSNILITEVIEENKLIENNLPRNNIEKQCITFTSQDSTIESVALTKKKRALSVGAAKKYSYFKNKKGPFNLFPQNEVFI